MLNQPDCIVCGSCVVDLLCRPVDLSKPIGAGVLHYADPVVLTGGGITLNSGVTMARLGAKVAIHSFVGDDAWAPVVRNLIRQEGIDDQLLTVHPTAATSTTVVAIDTSGERSFFHCVGAPQLLEAAALLDHLDIISRAKIFLLGYYSLMPNLEPDLPEVFRRIRGTGCKTALDAAGEGGSMQPLEQLLPHLDVYVPSLREACHQTGHDDPQKIIAAYRRCVPGGAPGLLGVKLGTDGVLLSPKADEFVHVDMIDAPGEVIDTTGAGDSFYAGLLTGLLRGMSVADSGKLGAAAAVYCVTVIGGSTGGRDYPTTAKLAGLG